MFFGIDHLFNCCKVGWFLLSGRYQFLHSSKHFQEFQKRFQGNDTFLLKLS